MKILVVGSGGREHALAWKASLSPAVSEVFVAPGNAGTALESGVSNVPLEAGDFGGLLSFALDKSIDLVIVGPENALVGGSVDLFGENGIRCCGPTRAGAMLEGSKEFSKEFLVRHNIPTARYRSFTDLLEAREYLRHQNYPLVVKADGLAAGKGVVICENLDQAEDCVQGMLSGKLFSSAGHKVVIEEFLEGEEASFICMVDGGDFLVMASSQDHKAAYNGDTGPNTGGMGAYSPAPVVDSDMRERVIEQIMRPAVNGLRSDGIPYTGFLYAGLMISNGVPNVLEFNCRLGDPEAQVILMRMKSDLVELCLAALDGRLAGIRTEWHRESALGVVMASKGYPESSRSGDVIEGLEGPFESNVKVFHAGTGLEDGRAVTSGGRVLCVTALADGIEQAQRQAYSAVRSIRWEGGWCRDDIGHRAVSRDG
ncbi:MAG: phosphoribosylamine--glycine ligase [Gammaproteobacteria bacterium]|nr:phosphoribosylamine--glycine ligase [Gammaproteobacteria bacterium]